MNLVSLESFLDNAAFLILLLTLFAYWSATAFPKPWLTQLASTGMAIANLTIAALLGARWLEAGYFPISNLYESLFFLAWGITGAHFIAERMSQSRFVGAVTAPIALGITALCHVNLTRRYAIICPPGAGVEIQLVDDARQRDDDQLRHPDGGVIIGDRLFACHPGSVGGTERQFRRDGGLSARSLPLNNLSPGPGNRRDGDNHRPSGLCVGKAGPHRPFPFPPTVNPGGYVR